MKQRMRCIFFCLVSLWLLNVVATQAQESTVAPPSAPLPVSVATSQSIFLDVKDLGTNVSTSKNWCSVWGSYSKNVTRARALELTLRNPSKLPGEFLVEWYFFAKPAQGGKRFLSGSDAKTINIAPGGIEKATVVSDTLNSSATHYASDYYDYSTTYKTGSKPEGWIVTVSTGSKMICLKTSSAQLEEIYKKPDQFKTLVGASKKPH